MPRIKDEDGDRWPITGCQCFVCKWPLIPVAGSTVHPLCEPTPKNHEQEDTQ